MKAAIYARVSSKTQNTRSQEIELKRWAERHDGPVKWFRDKVTGTNMDRPGFQAIMEGITRGDIDTLVIWRLDRLGRTAAGLTALFEDLQARGINLISIRDGLDFSTATGRLMANMIASIAQYETELRGERQRVGIEAAKAAGKKWGGSKRGRHTQEIKNKMRAVERLKAAGESITSISRSVGLSRPTIYRLLASQ